MPKMSDVYTPKYKGEKNPNEKILALGQKITDRIGHKVTSEDPEYWGLRCVCTEEMADLLLTMKVRVPYTMEELVKMTGKDEKYLEEMYAKMAYIGLVEYNWENPTRTKQYILPLFVPGSAEFTNMRKDQLDEHPELAQFFERMTFLPLEHITAMIPPGGAGIGMHVIPVEKAIEMENESIDIEHISYWLKKYEGKLSLGLCSCRYGRSLLKEGCGDSPEEWCIGVGDMADYCVETQKGRYATKEEVLEVLQRAEDNGFVHQITNIDGENKIFAICNCNVNICNALRTSQLFNTPNMSRSAYVARVNPENCVACGRCVEYCPAGAVKLGQKLCNKAGEEIKYPKQELPDHLSWGKDKWNEDYRDRNRINCYPTGTAPCKSACPAHIAVQGYLKLASQGRYKDALALIKKENPFPAICGRVCNKRCEEACTRNLVDKAVAIDDVKKFIAEQDLHEETRYIPPLVMPSNVGRWKEKIAIIGGGPAGLSCAFYLAEKGYYPVVFEKNERPGGMMMYGIPSYKLEKDVIEAEIEVLKEMGVEIRCNVEVGKDVSIKQLRSRGFKAFYIAIGCQEGTTLNIPGKEGKDVYNAIDFLKEAAFNHDKVLEGDVVVIGGGNVAIDASRVSHRFKANKVTMVCVEPADNMRASDEEVYEAKEEDVAIINEYGPKEIVRDENGNITSVVFKKCIKLFDENGKFNPEYDENDTIKIDANHVIFAIGQKPQYKNLLKGTKVEFNEFNYPKVDPLTYQSNEEDIFIGGDALTGPAFVIDAIEQGKRAAVSLHRFVQPGTSMTIGRNKREFISLNKEDITIPSYDNSAREIAGIDKTQDYKNSFKDYHRTLTEEQVKVETRRCLSCGASIVDTNKCIGCGICTTKCEFDAIHLFRELPEASKMYRSEDKFKAILPYMIKRAAKIAFKKKTPEEKESQRKHKEYKKEVKRLKKEGKEIE